MKRLTIVGLCSAAVFASAIADASAPVPTWFQCGKTAKSGKAYTGNYTGKACEAATKVQTGGKYELQEGIGKGKGFKGKGGKAILRVKTALGNDTVECASSTDSGTPALPNLETDLIITYKGCKAPSAARCSSAGARAGEIKLAGIKGELGYVQQSPTPIVDLTLESEAHPGSEGEIAALDCEGLQATVAGGAIGEQAKDLNVISREFETVGPDQTMLNKGEALMVDTNLEAGEPAKTLLIGEATPHEIAGDSKTDEITPVRFVAEKSGTVEEICYETGGYLFRPAETSLVLGIEEDINGVPGKVLGEGTYDGRLAINKVARASGLKVPITAGKVYFLDFLPLGGAVTYWYRKTEPVIYSVNHKKLIEGLPEEYEWIEEAEAAPIGIWANGT